MAAVEKHLDTDPTLREALESIAPAPGQVVHLHRNARITANNFEYADLLKGGPLGQAVHAVIEKDGSPLVYVAAIHEQDAERAQKLARLLGNRGETALLLDVHRSAKGNKLVARAWPCTLDADRSTMLDLTSTVDAASVLGDLQDGLWAQGDAYQEQRLRDLLVQSVSTVRAAFLKATARAGERGEEVLALVGRALFTRFLLDRGILSAATAPELANVLEDDGAKTFASASTAAAVCHWLDRTFNGEFLPLPAKGGYKPYFERLLRDSPAALAPLGWIVGKTDAGGQLPMWDRLDFSYIPVGTLSEVYEDYIHQRSPEEAKAKSVHYTPRHVARMMVRQAIAGLAPERAADATILDPSVGAAVYLSLAYRELARLREMRDGVWPDTDELRKILYGQLCGMDLNGAALNLAALTLYLTAIELDENPVPPEKLKFEHRLIGTVLRDVGRPDPLELHADALGSLRRSGGVTQRFNVVVGNPPWTSLGLAPESDAESDQNHDQPSDVFSKEATAVARRCIALRHGSEKAMPYAHPDKVPDLAFVWKATEWAAEGGIISLIVHQRLLTKRSEPWKQARKALFACIQIDGILDASEFANHDKLFWPGIETPYCVLFARNSKPSQDHETLLMTLAVEPVLRKRRQIRLDPASVASLRPEDFEQLPGGMVTRLKGCELDIALLARWAERVAPVVDPAFVKVNSVRGLPLTTIGGGISQFAQSEPKRGFKKGSRGAKLRPWISNLPASTKLLLPAKGRRGGEVRAGEIREEFEPVALKSTPPREHFQPPMLLLHQGAGNVGDLKRSIVVTPSESNDLVLYPFAFLGAPFEHTAQKLLYAQYVALWINSSVHSYFVTLTSTQLGFGIKALLNEDLLDTPMMDMDLAIARGLTSKQEIEHLFRRLGPPDDVLATAIDDWALKIIGADADERTLIEDTLSVSYPIGPSRHSGKEWVTNSDLDRYVAQLRNELLEVSDLIDTETMRVLPTDGELVGWRFVSWRTHGQEANSACVLHEISAAQLLRLVRDKYPHGQVWATAPGGVFVFGQLALRRLWLPSRACLAAQVLTAWIDQSLA